MVAAVSHLVTKTERILRIKKISALASRAERKENLGP